MSIEKPMWNDRNDRELYEFLFYKDKGGEPLTEEEKKFCTTMYHFEEYASGLDDIGEDNYEEDEDA